jgi:YfiH family protein
MVMVVKSLPQPSESFLWTQEPWGPALRCAPLLAVAPHLFTSAAITVSRDPGDPALAAVAASLGLDPAEVAQVHQVHGCAVVRFGRDEFQFLHHSNDRTAVAETEIRPDPISADALVSDDPHRAVGVRVADCVPILMTDRTGRVVAAVHAGWRGTAHRVAEAALSALENRFGIRPGDVLAALGPSIRACCYEVGPEVRDAFRDAGHEERATAAWFSPGNRNRLFLDVPLANRDQLAGLGVPPDQIFDSGLCTAHNQGAFHSYRRTGPHAGRALALIRVQGSGLKVQG